LTFELCPPVLHELGIGAGLEWLAEMMGERYNLQVIVEYEARDDFVGSPILTLAFRSVRELLMNVVKHARTDSARVKVWQEDELLHLQVSDQGAGFDPEDFEQDDLAYFGEGEIIEVPFNPSHYRDGKFGRGYFFEKPRHNFFAGEIAERSGSKTVGPEHVYKAKNKIELDCIAETIRTLPLQSKLVLMAILLHEDEGRNKLTTGEVYSAYRELCSEVGTNALTQRRITDLISELDMLGVINAKVKSFGRGGRTKEIQSSVPLKEAKAILTEDEDIQAIGDYRLKQMYL